MKKTILTIILLTIAMLGWSQLKESASETPWVGWSIFFPEMDENPTSYVLSLETPDETDTMIDSIDYIYYSSHGEYEYIPADDDPTLFANRLAKIEGHIPLRYNNKVHSFINYFTIKDREYTKMVNRRKELYFPIFERCLKKYQLPDELKYLSIIESGLNPKAFSRATAVGLWQFMAPTGRYYGLYQDWYIDDRMDPEKATDAACRYLRDLYNMFFDWELALAAYNTGPGNVRRAIRRSGYKKTFWDIYQFLPRETRSYVPQFVAITYTMNYLHEHNFIDDRSEKMPETDTILIDKFLHFETFACLTGTCLEDLQKLNPSVKHNAIPQTKKPFTFYLPKEAKEKLNANRLVILDSASKVGQTALDQLARTAPGTTYGRDKVIYRVRSGDVLGSIAIRFGVRVSDLKKWNNIKGSMIRTGQPLNIYLKPNAHASVQAQNNNTPSKPGPLPHSKTYIVQPGDTLWDISRRFEGLTIEKLKSLNKLTNNKIHAGQKLVLGI